MSVRSEMIKIYGGGYERFGDDPRAFLHNDQESQIARFQLCDKLFAREKAAFSVHEIGCSVGHLGEYIQDRFPQAAYSGSDIVPAFVDKCERRFPSSKFYLRDITETLPEESYDYVVTVGTFNIPGEAARDLWGRGIRQMLEAMYAIARKGLAITFLSGYHDPDRARADLHHQSETEMLDFTFQHLSRHVEIDKHGPLYEYALRVYRPEYVRSLYPQDSFSKYFRNLA